jgi:hypothetical protein
MTDGELPVPCHGRFADPPVNRLHPPTANRADESRLEEVAYQRMCANHVARAAASAEQAVPLALLD